MTKLKNNIHKKKYNYFFFDLDGVLINSLPNMKIAWKLTSKKFNIQKNFNDYRKYMGLPFFEILKKLKIKKNKFEYIKNKYEFESNNIIKKIKLYKNVKLILKKLKKKKYKTAIVTSKDFKRTNKILKQKKLKFNYVCAPKKKLKGKPYSDQLLYAAKKLNIKDLKKCVYIGDTVIDFKTSLNSNIDFILAKYGYGPFDNIKSNKILVNEISDIKELENFIK